MNADSQTASPELRLGLSRAIRAVGVDIGGVVGLVHKRIEFLTVMHARIGHVILPDQLVPGIRIDVVLVAKEALAVFLGSAHPCLSAGSWPDPSPTPPASCRSSRPHSLRGCCVAWAPARSWHQPFGRHAQYSPSPPDDGQSARTVSRSGRPSPASHGTATASWHPECRPRNRAAETA